MRLRRLIIVVSLIVLPVALYVLGYFTLLRGRAFELIQLDTSNMPGNLFSIRADYRAEGADWFFCPVHLLDRSIRSEYWTVVLPTE
jgi:hypothetical protein